MKVIVSPSRISLIGGLSDYKEYFLNNPYGLTLGLAINLHHFLIIRELPPFFDYKSRLVTSKLELISKFDEIQNNGIRGVLEYLDLKDMSLELMYYSDIPSSSGTGSSSAFICALLKGLDQYSARKPDSLWEACNCIERDLLKEPGGFQDPIYVSLGGFVRTRYDKTGVYPEKLKTLKGLEKYLLLLYNKGTRKSGEVIKSYIGKLEQDKGIGRIVEYTEKAQECLDKGDFIRFGAIIERTWEIKKALSDKVSTSELDDLYKTAIKQGCYGGKLLGGGGNGIMMMVCPPELHERVVKETGLLRIPFKVEENGTSIIYARD